MITLALILICLCYDSKPMTTSQRRAASRGAYYGAKAAIRRSCRTSYRRRRR